MNVSDELLDKGIYVTGTLGGNRRNNPQDIIAKKFKIGESVQCWSPEGIITKWRQKCVVLTISTKYSGEMLDMKDKHGNLIKKLEVVMNYNKQWEEEIGLNNIFHIIITNIQKAKVV